MDRTSAPHLYALALGSNRPLSARLGPRAILAAAVAALADLDGRVLALSRTIVTPPLGPSRRRFANAALVLETRLPPDALLHALKAIERRFGRRRGRRWAARSLDLDILLWSGGRWTAKRLVVPHPAYRIRDFVLVPLAEVAPQWRDPVTALTTLHLHARLQKSRAQRAAKG